MGARENKGREAGEEREGVGDFLKQMEGGRNRGKSIKSYPTMTVILQRKKNQREETKQKGARSMNACEVRKARDLDPPPSPSLPDLLARLCKVNLWNIKNSALFVFQEFVFQA